MRRFFLISDSEKNGTHFFVSGWIRIRLLLEGIIDNCKFLFVSTFIIQILKRIGGTLSLQLNVKGSNQPEGRSHNLGLKMRMLEPTGVV